MKNVLLTLVSCSALCACTAYPPKRPPASAYIRPVRPPGWTTGVDCIEELRRIFGASDSDPTRMDPTPERPLRGPTRTVEDYNAAVAGRELNRRLSEEQRARASEAKRRSDQQAEATREARQQQTDATATADSRPLRASPASYRTYQCSSTSGDTRPTTIVTLPAESKPFLGVPNKNTLILACPFPSPAFDWPP